MAMKRLSMVVAGGRITSLRLRAAAAPGCSFPPAVSCAARRQDQPILLKSRKGLSVLQAKHGEPLARQRDRWQVTSDTVGYARISLNYYGKNHI